MTSIQQTLASLRTRHEQFLEASYHLRHPRLIEERQRLIEAGTVYSVPWVDVMASYAATRTIFQTPLPVEVQNLLQEMKRQGLIKFDPPYDHQSGALEAFFTRGKELLVSTGTGSGKTEIFLWSMLGQLAQEAARGVTTSQRGIRAILLYPMNALVADQVARLRLLLGSTGGRDVMQKLFGRPIQFGMYTGRTPYPGPREAGRDEKRVRPILKHFEGISAQNPAAFQKLQAAGRVPAKDIAAFGGAGGHAAFTTAPGDSELLTRQEMYVNSTNGGIPDLLVTNNFMLEYMLLRPIEQSLFEETRKWLQDPSNQLLLILDEAHLYRGAQGAEVALLIRRLIQHLGISRDRVRCILTSASMGTTKQAITEGPKFAAQLTAGESSNFEVILGVQKMVPPGQAADQAAATALAGLTDTLAAPALGHLAQARTWQATDGSKLAADAKLLGQYLAADPLFHFLYNLVQTPKTIEDAGAALFPGVPSRLAQDATAGLLHLTSEAKGPFGRLLPGRVHQFFKGLPGIHACVRPTCNQRQAADPALGELLGCFYTESRLSCACRARVYELMSHRDCGAAYIRAFRRKEEKNKKLQFLWNESGHADELEEIHVLLESPRDDAASMKKGKTPLDKTLKMLLDVETGYVREAVPVGQDPARYIDVWLPDPTATLKHPDWPRTWISCPVCGRRGNRRPFDGMTKVMDLETKGEEPFANLVSTLFALQESDPAKTNLPNKGRKLLAFSDGRQKAARLARDLQRTVEQDAIRTAILATTSLKGIHALHQLYPAFLDYSVEHGLSFFDDGDSGDSRNTFGQHKTQFSAIRQKYQIPAGTSTWESDDAREELDAGRPTQFDERLLRTLGDRFYSFHGTTAAYCRPTDDVIAHLATRNPGLDQAVLEQALTETLRVALEDRAYDPNISDATRTRSRGGYPNQPEGLAIDELLPDHVEAFVRGRHGDSAVSALRDSLIISQTVQPRAPRLFAPYQNRWCVNPAAVTLEPAITKTWFRCTGCHQFSHVSLDNTCPYCSAESEPLEPDDSHRQSRKEFFLEPVNSALNGKPPTTIRSEEHSAQITSKDEADVWSRAEQYELLFQDILTEDPMLEPPIDVLSCTTTMEVGINIGALTGIALRTVPPRRDNYQQRAGRAGRAGSPLSSIVTFADNSPHETYVFHNPERLIAAAPTPPIIYIENERLLERHLNATFIQNYFRWAVPLYGVPGGQKGNDLLTALGQALDFLSRTGAFTLQDFKDWTTRHLAAETHPLAREIAALIPPDVEPNGQAGWQTRRVLARAKAFVADLDALAATLQVNPPADPEYGLLSALLDSGLLPRFSFPLHAVNFTVTSRRPTGIHKDYDMTQDRAKALSEYAPGRHVVVDKHTFASYGLAFKFPSDATNRASGPHWASPRWIHFCERCQSVLADENAPQPGVQSVCPIPTCLAAIQSLQYIVPEGFAPRVHSGKPRTTDDYEDERVYAVPAIYPLPNYPPVLGSQNRTLGIGTAEVRPNESLRVANFGPKKRGFNICRDCGAIERLGPLASGHDRPYALNQYAASCAGTSAEAALVHHFRTDLCVITIPFEANANFAASSYWFEAGARALVEAVCLAATRTLGIDKTELAGSYRVRGPPPGGTTQGYLEIFVYDSTPGGAGFSRTVYTNLDTVLQTAGSILATCNCQSTCSRCLSTYDNRRFHEAMDRHYGKAILDLLNTGTIGPLAPDRLAHLQRVVSGALAVVDEHAQVTPALGGLAVATKRQPVKVTFAPALQRTAADSTGNITLTDYDAMFRLPFVVKEILNAIKKS